jgi:hypothetical protein
MIRYRIAAWLFQRRFQGEGAFSSCDCHNIFNGYGHNVSLPIKPLETVDATFDLAKNRFRDLCLWLQHVRWCFPKMDRCQIVVGIPLEIQHGHNQIIKGWIPASRLSLLTPKVDVLDLASFNGASCEMEGWHNYLFSNGILKTDAI